MSSWSSRASQVQVSMFRSHTASSSSVMIRLALLWIANRQEFSAERFGSQLQMN